MKPEKNYTITKDARRVSIAAALDAVAKIREGILSAFVFEHGTRTISAPGSCSTGRRAAKPPEIIIP